ncbi:hypothetical protein OSTOST_06787 [Ostertagia ostertagi]
MLRKSRSLMSLIFGRKKTKDRDDHGHSLDNEASISHALIVIFLEYFAWGLLTVPVINVLAETFPNNKFLMNGMVLGIKGILSFLSAPLVGALSDVYGRKLFLILTVFCTCMPIPCLKISPCISGLFSVTFSVILAYVADITEKQDRSAAYGLVSATFAASLVTSPALGAWISDSYGDGAVVLLVCPILNAVLSDPCFDMVCRDLNAFLVCPIGRMYRGVSVPGNCHRYNRRGFHRVPCPTESLPVRRSASDVISWESADPFGTLRLVWEDSLVLQLALIVFLSYFTRQSGPIFLFLRLSLNCVAERPAFTWQLVPGPPFLAGALLVLLALMFNSALPASPAATKYLRRSPTHSRQSSDTARLLHADNGHC